MAGPEPEKLDIDAITNEGLASSGVGAPPIPKPTNPLDPGPSQTGRGGVKFNIEDPMWATPPSQEDFGQTDVRRGQYDTGLVTTPRQTLPFAALANRQMANQQRRATLEKQLADFDLYSKIGKAADPYQRNFGEMARSDMSGWVDEVAKAYGGDRREAIRQISSDPNLRAQWRDRSARWEEVGQTSQYLFKDAADLLLKAEMGEVEVDDDVLQAANELVQGQGTFGTNGQPDVHKQVELGRRYERLISREKYFKEFIAGSGLDKAVRTWQEQGKIDRASGMVRLTETEKKDFDGLIKAEAKRMAGMGMGSQPELEEYLRQRLPESQVVETKLVRPASSRGGSGAGGDKGGSAGEVETGTIPIMDASGNQIGTERILRKHLWKTVGGRKVPYDAINLTYAQGGDGKLFPVYVERRPDGVYVTGPSATEIYYTKEGRIATPRDRRNGNIDEQRTEVKQGTPTSVIITSDNAGAMSDLFGPNWSEGLGAGGAESSSASKPPTPEEFDAAWSKLPAGGSMVGPDGKTYTKK